MIEYAKDDAVHSLPLGSLYLGGSVGKKFEKVIYERMTSQKAHEKIFAEAEGAFRNCDDDKTPPLGMWQGEFWGKLIIGACRCCAYSGDDGLKEFIRGSVSRVLAFQRRDGYLGTYKNEKQIFRASVPEVRRLTGWNWDCDWTWNIWCRKYTLWGLIEAYILLGDEDILSSCVRFADQLIAMLDEMGAKICETGTFFGLPSGSVLKPMLILYRLTGEKRYLDFALEIAREWCDDTTRCCKIIKCALSDKPIHLWNYDTNNIAPASKGDCGGLGENRRYEDSHKAYEMMSCFDGLCELYRVTGDGLYLDAATHFWKLLIDYEYNPLFSVGFNDIFIGAANYENSVTELCDVIHFMRLGGELYKLTGDSSYLDYFELAFVNPFMAGVTRDGSWGARGVRGVEWHMYDKGQSGFIFNHCCVDNMPRGFINFAELAAVVSGDDLCINFYESADISHDGISAHISDGYRSNMRVTIDFDCDRECTVRLRIPSWSRETFVSVGSAVNGAEGEYYALDLPCGKTSVTIDFDKSVRIIKGDYNFNFFPTTPYMKMRFVSNSSGEVIHDDSVLSDNRARVCVGPSLLALSRDFGAPTDEIRKNHFLCTDGVSATAIAVEDDGDAAVFDVTFTVGGESFSLRMCDFASAADFLEYMDYRYTVFI